MAGLESSDVINARKNDWRVGPLIYQVMVDRFAPSESLDSKRDLYAAPRLLKEWNELPKHGKFLEDHSVWTHELEFWGGDLQSVIAKSDYFSQLGVDCVYLNPIHESFTNHKYGAIDYRKISPEFGTRDDVRKLAETLHSKELRLMLDGVFNHMGRRAPAFQKALANQNAPERSSFNFDSKYEFGYSAWDNAPSLPELNLENEAIQNDIWRGDDSVIASFLKDGVDGWRLDVAYDIGPKYLSELTQEAHRVKSDSCVICEVWSDPTGWSSVCDGVMNFNFRQMLMHLFEGALSGAQAARIFASQIKLGCEEGLLKSWLILDNHDTIRLRNLFSKRKERAFAQTLQFTLPGAPCIYYGVEVGMKGGDDPGMRAPMRWDLVTDGNEERQRILRLIKIRKGNPALKYGSTRFLDSEELLAFCRFTDDSREAMVIVANPSDKEITEVISPGISTWLHFTPLEDQLSDYVTASHSGLVHVTVPPKTVRVLKVNIYSGEKGYTAYKRIR